MNVIGTITEQDIFPDQTPTPQKQYKELRKAVRIVLLDDEKKVALSCYPPKEDHPNGEFSLPGGGVEESEQILDALARETLEETGCRIKNISELGMIKEYGIGKKTKHNQDEYCFTAEVDGDKGQPFFTEREMQDFLEIRWVPLSEAIQEISSQVQSFHHTRDLLLSSIINKKIGF